MTRSTLNWLSFAAGPWGNWGLVLANDLRIEAYIDSGHQGVNKALFDELQAEAGAWQARIGHPLGWERLDEKRASRIAAYQPVGDLSDDGEREQLRAWAVTTVLAMYDGMNQVLRTRARELREAVKMQELA